MEERGLLNLINFTSIGSLEEKRTTILIFLKKHRDPFSKRKQSIERKLSEANTQYVDYSIYSRMQSKEHMKRTIIGSLEKRR